MSRATVICMVEGQTENLFVERLLAPHLSGRYGVDVTAPIVTTSRDRRCGSVCKGGGRSFQKYVNGLRQLSQQYKRKENTWFTTLLDVYGLPGDFPQKEQGCAIENPCERVKCLESALAEKVKQELACDGMSSSRFIPHLMLHELETLLFAEIDQLAFLFPDKQKEIAAIKSDVRAFGNDVESINKTPEGAPSKRIGKRISFYGKYKAKEANGMVDILERIGLMKLRKACPHFGAWVTRLEQLGGDDE
jgi:hypothetical protein